MTATDVVVVGGGTAGCVVAARLSEDPSRQVLLLEAGPLEPATTPLLDARRVPGAEPDGAWNRWFPARLAPGRDRAVSRGRVLGGSSATNGAYFVRARPRDLADWSGGSGPWSPAAVLPLQRALERDLDFGTTALHGDRGPVPVSRDALDHPLAAAFVQAAVEAGHHFEADKNGPTEVGVGAMPANAVHGVRWSTATAYLAPALGRPNLRVVRASVDRVRIRRGRAVGVEAGSRVVETRRVVLAAGALSSPEVLLRSGVGPASALRRVGVPVELDAPGVGAALSDHPQVVVEHLPRAPTRPVAGWTGAMLHLPADDGGDLEVLQSLVPMAALTRADPAAAGPLPLLVSTHARQAPGTLTLEPDSRIRIDQGYLRTAADRSRLRQGVRAALDLLGGALGPAVGPAPATARQDPALDRWIAAHLGTALHACATIPWRLPDGSPGPVTQLGAVRGVDGLVVADTSILPTAPSRGPAATAVLVGELVAAHLR